MNKAIILSLAALAVFALSGCISGTQDTADSGAVADNGSGTIPNITIGTVSDAADTRPVFQTQEFGVLVTAPAGTRVEPWQPPAWSKQSVASAKFVRKNGNLYTLLVYRKLPGETYRQWSARSEIGDAYDSPDTISTLDGHLGYMYATGDLGALPYVHVNILTDRFVYHFHFEDGLPEDSEEAIRVTRERGISRPFQIPEDFRAFAKEIEVQ